MDDGLKFITVLIGGLIFCAVVILSIVLYLAMSRMSGTGKLDSPNEIPNLNHAGAWKMPAPTKEGAT